MPKTYLLTSSSNLSANTTPFNILQWAPEAADGQRPALIICILATCTHLFFWIQVFMYPSYRQRTMQWLYVYLITDQLLVLRFLVSYLIHTRFYDSASNATWALIVCFADATVDNYLNILAIYILFAINTCRYFQIVHNRNVYQTNPYSLVAAHIVIYSIPIIILATQLVSRWAELVISPGEDCDIGYTNIPTQVFNVFIGFALPICLNIAIILLNMRHIHLKTHGRQAHIRMTAQDKYHRSLVIQFLLFYIIWLTFWSPDVLVYQFTAGNSQWKQIVATLNYVGITLDPIIVAALDARVRKAWLSTWNYLKRIYAGDPVRIVPQTKPPSQQTRF